jgi:REP element-mobilizing transposase RayT
MVEVTTRTAGARLLLRPGPMLNERILGILGRALHLYPVELHAVVFLSNHWHALVTVADAEALAAFLRYVNGNVAKAVQEINGWQGPVWQRRAQVIVVADEAAAEARLRYVLAHGAKEGLVASPKDWPGVTCARALAGEERLVGAWVDRTRAGQIERGGRVPHPAEVTTWYPIELAPLPHWAPWPERRRRAMVVALIGDVEREARGRRLLGARGVLAQDPHAMPVTSKQGRAPWVHAVGRAARAVFLAARRVFLDAYGAAAACLRRGRPAALPAGCFPPRAGFVRRPSTMWHGTAWRRARTRGET